MSFVLDRPVVSRASALYRSAHSPRPAARPRPEIPWKSFLPIALWVLFLAMAVFGAGGCAPIDPGASSVVVTTERTIGMAEETVDSLLAFDDNDRDFMRTRLPAVHAVAERLRVEFPKARETANQAVRTYKQSRTVGDADKVEGALAAVQALVREARLAVLQYQQTDKGRQTTRPQ